MMQLFYIIGLGVYAYFFGKVHSCSGTVQYGTHLSRLVVVDFGVLHRLLFDWGRNDGHVLRERVQVGIVTLGRLLI